MKSGKGRVVAAIAISAIALGALGVAVAQATSAEAADLRVMVQQSGVQPHALGAAAAGGLAEGATRSHRFTLTAGRCYLFLASGADTVAALELRLFRGGNEIARFSGQNHRAAVDYCTATRVDVELRVRVHEGSGNVAVGAYGYRSAGLLATVGTPGRMVMPSALAMVVGRPDAGVTGPTDAGVADEDIGALRGVRIGGSGTGFLQTKIRQRATASAPGRRPITDLLTGTLQTAQSREFALPLRVGVCYTILASAMPSAGNLDLALFDPLGNRVVEDDTQDAHPSIALCAPVPGRYRLVVRMFSGYGRFAAQVLGARSE